MLIWMMKKSKQAVDALANMQMNEDDLDENAFNQAAAAAARAGKEEFEFGGKTYKTKWTNQQRTN